MTVSASRLGNLFRRKVAISYWVVNTETGVEIAHSGCDLQDTIPELEHAMRDFLITRGAIHRLYLMRNARRVIRSLETQGKASVPSPFRVSVATSLLADILF